MSSTRAAFATKSWTASRCAPWAAFLDLPVGAVALPQKDRRMRLTVRRRFDVHGATNRDRVPLSRQNMHKCRATRKHQNPPITIQRQRVSSADNENFGLGRESEGACAVASPNP